MKKLYQTIAQSKQCIIRIRWIISIFLTIGILISSPAFAEKKQKETTYDRVIRTGTIRCGYAIWEPILMKDPNTGDMSGIFYDYMNALGESLNLNVEWTEEIGWGDFPQALNTGRIDAFCVGPWPTAARARVVDFVTPIYFNTVNAYTKIDTTKFDNNINSINNEKIIISVIDGEMSSALAKNDFPKAKTLALPQLSNASQMVLNVVSGKADVFFTDTDTAMEFSNHNPEKIKQIDGIDPLRISDVGIAIARDQYPFKAMLETMTRILLQNGKIEKIIEKHEKYPNSLHRVSKPYK